MGYLWPIFGLKSVDWNTQKQSMIGWLKLKYTKDDENDVEDKQRGVYGVTITHQFYLFN